MFLKFMRYIGPRTDKETRRPSDQSATPWELRVLLHVESALLSTSPVKFRRDVKHATATFELGQTTGLETGTVLIPLS
jgi:hypothetical protein